MISESRKLDEHRQMVRARPWTELGTRLDALADETPVDRDA